MRMRLVFVTVIVIETGVSAVGVAAAFGVVVVGVAVVEAVKAGDSRDQARHAWISRVQGWGDSNQVSRHGRGGPDGPKSHS